MCEVHTLCVSLCIHVDEPDVGTLPHTKVYCIDDDKSYSSDEESNDSGNETMVIACVSCVCVYEIHVTCSFIDITQILMITRSFKVISPWHIPLPLYQHI